jgi:cell division protein FtsQ
MRMWDDVRQLNFAAAALTLVAVLALVWGALAWALRQPPFAFREVIVHGPLERASAAHVEAAIREELTGTFFTMNLDRARSALARVPWVRNVALRRQWPQRLDVTIEEHAPVARWNDAGLVNVQGEVFVADYDGELPQFSGPEGRSAEITGRYREWSAALHGLALSVQELRLSPRGAWRLVAVSRDGPLAIEMGRDEPGARLARFIAAYGRTIAVLNRGGTRIDHVDLRYRTGFAARVPGFKERPQKRTT